MTAARLFGFFLLISSAPVLAVTPVTVAPLSSQVVESQLRAPAIVVPANRAVISSQISALVKDVLADVGATVTKGAVLIRLDDADASLALKSAEAQLAALDAQIEQARRQLKRGEELFATKYISDEELFSRRTNVAVLEANRAAQLLAVNSARLSLSRTVVRAPFAAAVVARAAQVGSLAQPGTPLITLVQTTEREVNADLDPRYVAGLDSAAELAFETQGTRYPVEVARLSPVIETDSRTITGRFTFSGDAAFVGASGELVWRDASGLIPVSLIVQRDGKLGVFVADGTRARFVPVSEAQEGRPARSDLPRDTLLIVRGQSRLQDGDELSITRQ